MFVRTTGRLPSRSVAPRISRPLASRDDQIRPTLRRRARTILDRVEPRRPFVSHDAGQPVDEADRRRRQSKDRRPRAQAVASGEHQLDVAAIRRIRPALQRSDGPGIVRSTLRRPDRGPPGMRRRPRRRRAGPSVTASSFSRIARFDLVAMLIEARSRPASRSAGSEVRDGVRGSGRRSQAELAATSTSPATVCRVVANPGVAPAHARGLSRSSSGTLTSVGRAISVRFSAVRSADLGDLGPVRRQVRETVGQPRRGRSCRGS